MTISKQLDKLLMQVEKADIGGELHTVKKTFQQSVQDLDLHFRILTKSACHIGATNYLSYS